MTILHVFRHEVLRFLFVGGVAASVNFFSRFLLALVFPFEISVIISYVIGMLIAFCLFQRFVFGNSGDAHHRQAVRFILINILGILISVAVSSFTARVVVPLINWTYFPFATAHLAGIIAPAVTSYFGHKFYTYKKVRRSSTKFRATSR